MSGKGSEYERRIAKFLSRWWSNGERDDIFWRSQQSGGRATIRARRGKSTANQQGDLQAMDVIGQPLIDRVCIELKKGYKDFGFDALLLGNQRKSVFDSFVQQCEREAEGRYWWLIVKKDFKADIICFPLLFVSFLRERGCYNDLVEKVHLVVAKGQLRVVAYKFSDFFGIVKPEVFGE